MPKVTATINLQPFPVPDYAYTEAPSMALYDPNKTAMGMERMRRLEQSKVAFDSLDTNTLHDLCDEFKAAVFAKAGHNNIPPRTGP